MGSLKDLLKTTNSEKTDWEKFDWANFDHYLKNHQENGDSDLNREEVIELNVIRGFQLIYDLRSLKERRKNLREHKREYERNLRGQKGNVGEHRRNLGALKSSYDSPKPSYGSLKKPAFRIPKLEKVEPQSRSGRTYSDKAS